jgi:hypothetical protein
VHDPAPLKLYCPAAHADALADVEPAGHANPALHGPEHAELDRPATAPYWPGGHGPLHDALPLAAENPNCPAAQSVHTAAPLRLYLPAGHVWAVADVDPAGHAYPAVHIPEHDAVEAPDVDP